jgi:hypothetical protein
VTADHRHEAGHYPKAVHAPQRLFPLFFKAYCHALRCHRRLHYVITPQNEAIVRSAAQELYGQFYTLGDEMLYTQIANMVLACCKAYRV